MKFEASGPWDNEPDFWEAEMMGMVRQPGLGNWCGYAAVPPGHFLHNKHYSDTIPVPRAHIDREIDIDKQSIFAILALNQADVDKGLLRIDCCFDVHGGITYSDDHCPYKEPDGNWWFGFDCGHAGDLQPRHARSAGLRGHRGEVYRDFNYVRSEVISLSRQLARWVRTAQMSA